MQSDVRVSRQTTKPCFISPRSTSVQATLHFMRQSQSEQFRVSHREAQVILSHDVPMVQSSFSKLNSIESTEFTKFAEYNFQ